MTRAQFKPVKFAMLATSNTLSEEDIANLSYPVLVSTKLDGMRVLLMNGKLVSRNGSPIANNYVREWCEANLPDGVDGELCLPDMTEPLEDVMSAMRSVDGEPEFVFAAFDFLPSDQGGCPAANLPQWQFKRRLQMLDRAKRYYEATQAGNGQLAPSKPSRFFVVPQIRANGPEEVHDFMAQFLEMGYEGLMVRSYKGAYKNGRATLKEGTLMKYKPWHDEEGILYDVEEEMKNLNEERTVTGARSTKKAGKVGSGRAGALLFEFEDGTRSSVGGLTNAQKDEFWALHLKHDMVGRSITVRYQLVHGGRAKGQKPRHPQFKGFSDHAWTDTRGMLRGPGL